MEKLSIEQKAKAYDELLLKLQKAKVDDNVCDEMYYRVIDDIVPELKESEDERVKRCISDVVRKYGSEFTTGTVTKEKMFAWLEKQGSEPNWCHHKVDLSNCSEEYRKAYYDGWNNCNMQHSQCKSDGIDVVKCLINGMKFYYEDNEEATWGTEKFSMKVKDILAWLEKQGEQKQDPCDNCKDVMLNCHNFPCIKKRAFKQGKSVLEAIIDEKVDNANKVEPKDYSSIDPHFGKPVDKVKPKFKQGQWIVWKDKCYKVNYNGCGYELIDQNGLSTSLEYGTVDTSARLWDVTKDAKAGDVLVIQETDFTYESIFIFNKIENNHIIQYLHYFITDTDEEVCKVKSVGGFLGDVGDNVHPTTKEQRDTLMKAMADAGYAFDFDKKKLKKIEQKPVSISPIFEVGDVMRTKEEATKGLKSGMPVVVSIDKEYYHCNNELIAIKDQYDYEYPPMNRIQKPVDDVEPFDKYEGLTDFERTLADICLGWISEEESGWKQYIKDNADVLLKIAVKKFNSAQEQNPAWSEEDEKMLNSSVDNLTELMLKYGERYGNVGKCIDWLKSLRPHSTWKPSDKQINAIRLARSFVTDDFGANPTLSDTLVELEKQLKKLKGGVKLCYI